ncbi:hypothetical protein [Micromonospora zamorensis]|uniref:hypothetical protein n=1 Tax=Micromonospora zamorensis TaxID=709883 RepID=UPI002E17DB23|nr:hypothetical protein OG423_09225 [Micromonospora zamorensis]WTE86919.1 hypothetical protein OHA01_31210 [Micromonospora zamorensis]
MTTLSGQRILAIVLLLLAFLTLVASRAFPFVDDLPGAAESAIVFVGAACALTGVWLWLRKTPDRS